MRNYKKEYENNKKNYERLNVAIDKKLGIKLKNKFKKENISVAKWITDNAENFLCNKLLSDNQITYILYNAYSFIETGNCSDNDLLNIFRLISLTSLNG